MAPAMKVMKKAAGATGLTASAAFTKVAETTELKPKAVKAVVTNYLQLAATELKKNGKFKLGDLLNMNMRVWPHQQHHSRLCPDERTVHLRMGPRISLSSS